LAIFFVFFGAATAFFGAGFLASFGLDGDLGLFVGVAAGLLYYNLMLVGSTTLDFEGLSVDFALCLSY